MGLVSQSGFGLNGILNRQNIDEIMLDNFYVFTNPNNVKYDFAKRDGLKFMPFNISLLYLDNFISI
jgi:hypothetical protein